MPTYGKMYNGKTFSQLNFFLRKRKEVSLGPAVGVDNVIH